MKSSAKRFLKVREAVCVLIQATEEGEIKIYENLSEDDQNHINLFAKGLIDLTDGLLTPYKRKDKS